MTEQGRIAKLEERVKELATSLNWYIGENDRMSKAWSVEWKGYLAEKQKMMSEIERLRTELATAKEDWHNQYTTSMHLSAELAEAKEEIDHLRAACGLGQMVKETDIVIG